EVEGPHTNQLDCARDAGVPIHHKHVVLAWCEASHFDAQGAVRVLSVVAVDRERPRRTARADHSAAHQVAADDPVSAEQPTWIDYRVRAGDRAIDDQASPIHRRRTGVGVRARQRQRAGAQLAYTARAADLSAKGHSVRAIEYQCAIVDDVSDDASGRSTVTELER